MERLGLWGFNLVWSLGLFGLKVDGDSLGIIADGFCLCFCYWGLGICYLCNNE